MLRKPWCWLFLIILQQSMHNPDRVIKSRPPLLINAFPWRNKIIVRCEIRNFCEREKRLKINILEHFSVKFLWFLLCSYLLRTIAIATIKSYSILLIIFFPSGNKNGVFAQNLLFLSAGIFPDTYFSSSISLFSARIWLSRLLMMRKGQGLFFFF